MVIHNARGALVCGERDRVYSGPSLDDWSFQVHVQSSLFTLNQLLQQDLSSPYLHSRVVLTHVDVELERLSLQEVHVEAVNFVYEGELCLIVRSQTFTHLSRLRAMIVEINCDNSDELTVNLFLG